MGRRQGTVEKMVRNMSVLLENECFERSKTAKDFFNRLPERKKARSWEK